MINKGQSVDPKKWRAQLHAKPRFSKGIVYELKTTGTFQSIVSVALQMRDHPTPFKSLFFGRMFPAGFQDIQKDIRSPFTNDLGCELRWAIAILASHKKQVVDFLQLKQTYERALLLGHYDKAQASLDQARKAFGVSLWLLEQRFLLAQLTSGLSGNLKIFNEINTTTGISPLVTAVAAYLSMRVETNVSADTYVSECNKVLDSARTNSPLLTYLRYQINPLDLTESPTFTSILPYAEENSFVDRLLGLKHVIMRETALRTSPPEEIKESVTLYRKAVDSDSFETTNSYLFPFSTLEPRSQSVAFLECLDKYTSGNYQASLIRADELILEDPTNVAAYHLSAFSSIYLNAAPPVFSEHTSLAASIRRQVYQSLLEGADSEEADKSLNKTAFVLSSSSISLPLLQLVKTKSRLPVDGAATLAAALHNPVFNPRFAFRLNTTEQSFAYLRNIETTAGTSCTVELVRATLTSRTKKTLQAFPSTIPAKRRLYYEAQALFDMGDYEQALAKFKELKDALDLANDPEILLYRAFEGSFRCLLKEQDILSCVILTVDHLLERPSLLRKLPMEALIQGLFKIASFNSLKDIRVAIFCALFSRDRHKTYIAYDNYLSSISTQKPSDLFLTAGFEPPPHFVPFLRYVCTTDIMSRSRHFRSTSDLENERIKICQLLTKEDASNADVYSKEINDITQRLVIRKGLQRINESKIYVDEKGIRKAFERALKESFSRIQEHSAVKKVNNFQLVDTRNIQVIDVSSGGGKATVRPAESTDLTEEIKIITSSQLTLYRNQFLDVRDKFVSSNEYGLDSYLSVRIRHGTLQGAVRSIFESYNLLCQKDKTTSAYLENSYWKERLSTCPAQEMKTLQSLLADFSSQVDDVTSRLKEQLIQVRTENRNSNGLFDYRFSDLEIYGVLLKDNFEQELYETHLDKIFEALWKRTKVNLKLVRNYFKNGVKDTLYTHLSDLITNIREACPSLVGSEFLQNLTTCLTDLQNSLDRISAWFNMSHDTVFHDFSLAELMDVTVQSINNIYPAQQITVKTEVDDVRIKGKYFVYLADIMRSLLDNVVQHSGLISNAQDVKVSIKAVDDRLTITVVNLLAQAQLSGDPVATLRSRIEEIRLQQSRDAVRQEGGSGYAKLNTILEYGLARSEAAITFEYLDKKYLQVTITMESKGLDA